MWPPCTCRWLTVVSALGAKVWGLMRSYCILQELSSLKPRSNLGFEESIDSKNKIRNERNILTLGSSLWRTLDVMVHTFNEVDVWSQGPFKKMTHGLLVYRWLKAGCVTRPTKSPVSPRVRSTSSRSLQWMLWDRANQLRLTNLSCARNHQVIDYDYDYRNAPQGVENVHTLCAGEPESDDWGSSTYWT